MKRTIETFTAVHSDAAELLQAIVERLLNVPAVSAGAVQIQDTQGNALAEIALQEETLTDQSTVYNLVLRFSNID